MNKLLLLVLLCCTTGIYAMEDVSIQDATDMTITTTSGSVSRR